MKINSITAHWHNCDRVVLATEDLHGLVEIQYPKDAPDVGYIWNLWIDPEYRRKGYATALLDEAERQIAEQGCRLAELEWCDLDTPYDIFKWYERRGYNETQFGKHISRLAKRLDV